MVTDFPWFILNQLFIAWLYAALNGSLTNTSNSCYLWDVYGGIFKQTVPNSLALSISAMNKCDSDCH